MMRTNTKKFKLLKFLTSQQQGTRYMDIERFICEMNGFDYDEKIIRGCYAGKRKHSGIWGTNLTSGRDSILKKYCFKSNGLWFVNGLTEKFINSNLAAEEKVPSMQNVTASSQPVIKDVSIEVADAVKRLTELREMYNAGAAQRTKLSEQLTQLDAEMYQIEKGLVSMLGIR